MAEYWDKQLLSLIRYGFPLDFDYSKSLNHELNNHSSATIFSQDVEAYLQEEIQLRAIHGSYGKQPLQNMHFSPFLTRENLDAEHRRVIVDLSYPLKFSVNAWVKPKVYLNMPFILTLPTIDNITRKV